DRARQDHRRECGASLLGRLRARLYAAARLGAAQVQVLRKGSPVSSSGRQRQDDRQARERRPKVDGGGRQGHRVQGVAGRLRRSERPLLSHQYRRGREGGIRAIPSPKASFSCPSRWPVGTVDKLRHATPLPTHVHPKCNKWA
ncbi:hypothetical protein EMIHUDRAFT_458969, partial [Emiliania huxleyi CCMP1516]|uniref:Uncharacterized protein n=2 Tax=Emiliania huxleyi TaxID=2903 RepID=A0A0D3J202_EMIH1